jgi:hypothetical protein
MSLEPYEIFKKDFLKFFSFQFFYNSFRTFNCTLSQRLISLAYAQHVLKIQNDEYQHQFKRKFTF